MKIAKALCRARFGVLAVSLLCGFGLFAETYTWVGASDGDWEVAENWDPNTGYPSAADDTATIPNPEASSAAVTITVNTPFKIAALSVGGTAGMSGKVTLCFKTGLATNEVSGDVSVGSGGILTHFGPNDTITQRLALKVGGAMTVAAGGSVDVRKKGYSDHKGPGNKRCTPLYGGETAEYCNWTYPIGNGRAYGSIRKPLDYGSGTHDGGTYTMGAGSVYLDVAGVLTVNGTLTSSASHGESNNWIGAPGSIFVTCGTLFGAGVIEARAGYAAHGSNASTSGGRIAIYQTGAASLASFTGILRTGRAAALNGTCGTIYIENSGDTAGQGTLIIDNDGNLAKSNQGSQPYLCTTIDPQVTDSSEPFGTVIVRNGGHLKICNGATLKVAKSLSVDSASRLTANTGHAIELVGSADCTITGGSYMTLDTLVCTNAPGKTIKFGTATADKITIATNKKLILKGTSANPLVLSSTTSGTKWQLYVDADAAESTVEHVNVKDSDASSGACVLSIGGTNLGGNSYWGFSAPIAPGEAISWTGAADTAWQNPANWSKTRIPVASDVITIPTVATSKYPTLGYGTYFFNKLTVDSGATLTVNTATTTVTNDLRVAGALVFSGTESFSAHGNIDFTDGTLTAASSRFYLVGTGNQTLEADGNMFNLLQWSKPSGDLSFGTTACSAANFGCGVTVATKITFAAGKTYTFPALTFSGTSSKLLTLVSSAPGTKWKLVTTSTGQSVSGVDATDSDATDGAKIMAGRESTTSNCDNWDTVTEVATWLGGSGNFTDAAKWSTGAVPGAGSLVTIAGGDMETLTVTLPANAPTTVASLTVKGSTGGMATLVANSPLTVVGDLEIWDCGVVELNCYNDAGAAPNAVTNNVRVRSGGLLTHKGPADTEGAKVHLAVCGNLTVDAGGAIDVSRRGYKCQKGPGRADGNGTSAAHAGWGNGTGRSPYGSILHPVTWGSGGPSNGSPIGGGAIHLVVTGTLTVEGSILSEGGNGSPYYSGPGGSIWIECGTLTGSGLISGRSGTSTSTGKGQYTSSGGRVAVYQKVGTDFTAFPKERILAGRDINSAPGTVYLEAADTSNGTDLYVLGTGNTTTYKTPFPMPDDGNDYSVYSNINIHVGIASVLSIGGMTDATGRYCIRSLDVANGGKAELVSGATLAIRRAFSVDSKSSVSFVGGNTLDFYGDGAVTVTGFARSSGLATFSCTTPGKTLKFGTAANDQINIPGENALTLKGSDENPVQLLPADGTGTWKLNVSASAVTDIRNVAVSNSNASVGAAVTAINSGNLGGNTSWSFSAEIRPGDPIVWTGADSTDWALASNWDRKRTPIATDYITIPALAGETPNYPTLGEGVLSYCRITVASGAALTLAGTTLTVTNQFNVHGSLTCSDTTSVALPGDADFSGATVTPGASLWRITGDGNQTLDFGDATFSRIVFVKPSGNVSFGTHGFTAASFRCFTSAALDFTFASGATYDFAQFYVNGAADSGYPIRFRASTDGTAWKLVVKDHAHALGGVSIKDCDAIDKKLYAGIRCEDALNNTNVDFAQDVVTYVGGATGDFMAAANWSSGAVPGANTVVQLAAADGETPVVTLAAAAGAQTIKALYIGGISDGRANLVAKAPLVVRTGVEVRTAGTLTLDAYDDYGEAPNVISNNLHVFSGGLVTHTGPADTENAKVHLEVRGDVTVDAGGAFDVSSRGYLYCCGPGRSLNQGKSPSYAGWGNMEDNTSLPYGSILRPFRWGSGVCNNGWTCAGGAIRLVVGGTLTVDGVIKSEGGGSTHYTSTGGSIWITCGTLTGEGVINARTGSAQYPGAGAYTGSGGRIAVYQTVGTDFSAFPHTRIIAGRDVYSASGTVYLEAADKTAGADLYIEGSGNSTTYKTPFPMPDDGSDYSIYSNVNVHVGIASVLSIGGMTAATGTYSIRSIDVANGGKVELVDGATLMTRRGLSIGTGSSFACKGEGTLVLTGSDDATLTGFTRITGLDALVCTNAGKTVYIATNAADAVTIGATSVVTLKGTQAAPVSLLPLGGYGIWPINVAAAATSLATFRELSISNSNASVGAALTAINSHDLGGNSSWSFSEEILPGQIITWTGGASTAWGGGANWDRKRVPVATDYIVIPSLGGDTPNYPTLGEGAYTFDRITVASGARFTLDGTTLTVTGQLNNHGALVCTDAETIVLKGSADFSNGGTMTPANSVLRVSGTDDQALDFNDATLGDVVLEKASGDVAFAAHGFTVRSLHCRSSRAITLSFASGATYDFGGFYAYGVKNGVVSLVSDTPGTRWNAKVYAGRHAFGYVSIKDCNADGTTLYAGKLATNGGNNNNVNFAEDVALWIGGSTGFFSSIGSWTSGTVPGADTIVVMAPAPGVTEVATVLANQPASVRSLTLLGAATFIAKSALTASGSVTVGSGSALTLDCFNDAGAAPNVIGGDLNVLAGGQVTHSGPAATEAAKLHLKVCGNVTVASGASVTATGKGYTKGNGPGASPLSHCIGGAYAGFGSGNTKSPYGSVLKPFNYGATINRDIPSGGAIHLDVVGTLRVDGTVEAEGKSFVEADYSAGGGSVWIECGALLGDGLLSVREGDRTAYGWAEQTSGSGGRIAVYQRVAKDFAAFPKARMLTQRVNGVACGTVYLASAFQNDGTDLYIDGAREAKMETLLPMPADGDPMKVYADINLHIGANAKVAICAYDAGTQTKSATRVKFRDLTLATANSRLNLYGSTVEVRSFKHQNGRKWYKNYTESQSAGLLSLGGTAQAPGAIVWKGGIGTFLRVR